MTGLTVPALLLYVKLQLGPWTEDVLSQGTGKHIPDDPIAWLMFHSWPCLSHVWVLPPCAAPLQRSGLSSFTTHWALQIVSERAAGVQIRALRLSVHGLSCHYPWRWYLVRAHTYTDGYSHSYCAKTFYVRRERMTALACTWSSGRGLLVYPGLPFHFRDGSLGSEVAGWGVPQASTEGGYHRA